MQAAGHRAVPPKHPLPHGRVRRLAGEQRVADPVPREVADRVARHAPRRGRDLASEERDVGEDHVGAETTDGVNLFRHKPVGIGAELHEPIERSLRVDRQRVQFRHADVDLRSFDGRRRQWVEQPGRGGGPNGDDHIRRPREHGPNHLQGPACMPEAVAADVVEEAEGHGEPDESSVSPGT